VSVFRSSSFPSFGNAFMGIILILFYFYDFWVRRNKEMVEIASIPVPGSKDLYFRTQYSQSFWTQIRACLWKQHWTYWRSPDYNCVRLFFTFVSAVLFGTIFWNIGKKT
jgi:hypothetical protein